VRPRDKRNIYESLLNRGLFSELGKHVKRRRSGASPIGPARPVKGKRSLVRAPVFFDVAYDQRSRLVEILFWFFYALNRSAPHNSVTVYGLGLHSCRGPAGRKTPSREVGPIDWPFGGGRLMLRQLRPVFAQPFTEVLQPLANLPKDESLVSHFAHHTLSAGGCCFMIAKEA
jgi:hypothetical protein